MTGKSLFGRADFAIALSALFIWSAGAWADDAAAPKVTSRPLDPGASVQLTTLDDKAALALSQSVIGKRVGDFTLLDRQGRPVRLSDYRGRPLLVSFIYTGCFEACPTTTRNLQKAVESATSALGAERFRVVSIGFNQPFDSPEAMRSFALKHGAGLPNWEFLSPAPAIIDALTREFGFSYVATPAGFDHINQVTIVDASGVILRQVYGEKPTADDLVEPIKLIITGAPLPAQAGTLAELVERVRILCSVYDPASGEYRLSYSFVIEILGFVTFFAWAIYFLWREQRRRKLRSL
jgi:protein SCO1/2